MPAARRQSDVHAVISELWTASKDRKIPDLSVPEWRRRLYHAISSDLDYSPPWNWDPDLDHRVSWARAYLSWCAGTATCPDAQLHAIAAHLLEPSPPPVDRKLAASGS